MERFQYIAHSRIFKHTSELEEFCKEKWKKTPKVQTEKKTLNDYKKHLNTIFLQTEMLKSMYAKFS